MAGLLKADDSGTMRLGHHIAALALAGMFAGCAWILFSFSPFGFWSSRLPSAAVFGLILSVGVRAISNRGDGVARISTPLPSQSGPIAFGLGALGFGLGVTLCGLVLLPQQKQQLVMILKDGRQIPHVRVAQSTDEITVFKTHDRNAVGLRIPRHHIVRQARIDPREQGLASLRLSALVGLCGGLGLALGAGGIPRQRVAIIASTSVGYAFACQCVAALTPTPGESLEIGRYLLQFSLRPIPFALCGGLIGGTFYLARGPKVTLRRR